MQPIEADEISDVLDIFCIECGEYKDSKSSQCDTCKISWYSEKVLGLSHRCNKCNRFVPNSLTHCPNCESMLNEKEES